MHALTKAQLFAPKRATRPVQLPEFDAPLLLREPSAALGFRLRSSKVEMASEDGLAAMLADMVVDENGDAMLSTEEATTFLERLSMTSATRLLRECLAVQAPAKDGAEGNSKPSPSAS